MIVAIVVAAGPGSRLGAGQPKGFVPLGGEALFVRAVRALLATPAIDCAVVVVPPARTAEAERLLDAAALRPPATVVAGGRERQESVRLGLAAAGEAELVVIHDAARPFVAPDTVAAVIAAARAHGAAIAALPATDTVKLVDAAGQITATPPRERVWLAQTPQAFRTALLRAAHDAAGADTAATDDAMLVEQLGQRVHVVPGSPDARKITTRADLEWAEWQLTRPAGPR